MEERAVRQLLLARACEEEDPQGVFIPEAARRRADRDAREALGRDPETPDEAARQLVARAAALLQRVGERGPEHDPGLATAERLANLTPPVAVAAGVGLLLGLGFDALGSGRRVSLLAFPVIGTLLWNGAVIVAQLGRGLAGRTRQRGPERVARAWQAIRLRLGGHLSASRAAYSRSVLAAFARDWLATAGPLEAARWRARLHVAALAFALGVVLRMYVAGFAFAYRATWESTFLDAEGVHTLLGLLLGPASQLLALPLPDVAGIAALEAPGSGEAAPWVHRWALTTLLFAGVPRALLALSEAARARRLARDLSPDWEALYYARLLAGFRGAGDEILVLPYSLRLAPEAAKRVHELLWTLFGNRSRVRVAEPAAYGDPPPGLAAAGDAEPRAAVVIFNLAQSPEQEVHGDYVEEIAAWAQAAGEKRLLVLLDETRYRQTASPDRVEERRASWQRVLAEAQLGAASLTAERDPAALLADARDALTDGSR